MFVFKVVCIIDITTAPRIALSTRCSRPTRYHSFARMSFQPKRYANTFSGQHIPQVEDHQMQPLENNRCAHRTSRFPCGKLSVLCLFDTTCSGWAWRCSYECRSSISRNATQRSQCCSASIRQGNHVMAMTPYVPVTGLLERRTLRTWCSRSLMRLCSGSSRTGSLRMLCMCLFPLRAGCSP